MFPDSHQMNGRTTGESSLTEVVTGEHPGSIPRPASIPYSLIFMYPMSQNRQLSLEFFTGATAPLRVR